MLRIVVVTLLTVRQCWQRAWCWLAPGILMVAFLFFVRDGKQDLEGFYHSTLAMTALIFAPLTASAGVIADEVASGRALMLHGLSLTRKEFVVGRWLGTCVFSFSTSTLVQILVSFYLAFSGRPPKARDVLAVAFSTLLYLAYVGVQLTLLSVFMRSWGNAALLFGVQSAAATILQFVSQGLGTKAKEFLSLGQYFFAGPLSFVIQSARSSPPLWQETTLVVFLGAVWLAIAIYSYGRLQLGERVGRV